MRVECRWPLKDQQLILMGLKRGNGVRPDALHDADPVVCVQLQQYVQTKGPTTLFDLIYTSNQILKELSGHVLTFKRSVQGI